MTAPMACSRMPKWKFRPPRLSAWKSPAPSNVRRVLVEGARSADAADQPGHVLRATAFSTLPDASRVASPLGRRGTSAIPCPSPSGSSRRLHAVRSGPRARDTRFCTRRTGRARRRAAPGRGAPMPALKCSRTPSGTRNCRLLRPAVEALGQPDLLGSPSGSPWAALRVLLVGGAVADVAVDDDQRGPVGRVLGTSGTRARASSRSLASPTRVTFQP